MARTTLIAAHRGGAALNPENSRAAFAHALALGADQIETDVHLSADGIPVLMHDTTLERTTHGLGAVRDHGWRQLRSVRLRNSPECVPHLDELLVLLQNNPGTNLRLELKVGDGDRPYPGLVGTVLKHLQHHGLMARTTISSFAWKLLVQVHEHAPALPRVGLVRREVLTRLTPTGVLQQAQALGLEEIAVHDGQFSDALPALAAEHGVRLGLYAVNSLDSMQRALVQGVSAFTTDHPDQALALRRDIAASGA